MSASELQAARSAVAYIVSNVRGPVADWYVGIAARPHQRLAEHGVSPERAVIVQTSSEQVARATERILLDMGFDGGSGGGDAETVWVYAFRMTSQQRDERLISQQPRRRANLATPASKLVTGRNSNLFKHNQ